MLRFHVAAQAVEIGPTRADLEAALERADDVLREGRERVRDLRAIDTGDDLDDVIPALLARQEFPAGIEVAFATKGKARAFDRAVIVEVAAIVGEALFNACRHSSAATVRIMITSRLFNTVLSIRDDGIGKPADILQANGRTGRFGLIGMRERAREIGARLSIRSRQSGGTEVLLTIPRSHSYRR